MPYNIGNRFKGCFEKHFKPRKQRKQRKQKVKDNEKKSFGDVIENVALNLMVCLLQVALFVIKFPKLLWAKAFPVMKKRSPKPARWIGRRRR